MSTTTATFGVPTSDNLEILDQLAQKLNADPAQLIAIAQRAIVRAATKGTFHPETLLHLLEAQGDEHTLRTFGRIGTPLRVQDVRNLTGWSKSGVHKAKSENRLMAFRLPGQSIDLFPLLQFEPSKDGSKVRAWMPELLGSTGNGSAALHFLTARRTSLGGKSYAEKLAETEYEPALVAQMLVQARRIGEPAA